MYLKVHRSPDGNEVVAVCDRELMNATVRRGDLEICIRKDFYGDRLSRPEDVRSLLAKADNINLMGERVVALAIEMGLVEQAGCIMFGTIPHAQVIRI
ncbi:MAG TPA: DUF424 domain-containing protein [Methanoregulaceae archaeon]|jgi:hypothetical protein|nr:DUF424 domain-containing protein [Methanolinea sp.]MCC7567978.1 DUF424 domain-containing protein [Methanoregulaceae archaeon]MDD3091681.1 DUF424 domain-containing protein [Methanoregulaceae archaeon]MDD5048086.1 DUF424 domain-containing protein [Methanoregulaceae archaeon]MDD5684771.1 DUF424 domain-containing protein [Methanoregulaceae archaeon]